MFRYCLPTHLKSSDNSFIVKVSVVAYWLPPSCYWNKLSKSDNKLFFSFSKVRDSVCFSRAFFSLFLVVLICLEEFKFSFLLFDFFVNVVAVLRILFVYQLKPMLYFGLLWLVHVCKVVCFLISGLNVN